MLSQIKHAFIGKLNIIVIHDLTLITLLPPFLQTKHTYTHSQIYRSCFNMEKRIQLRDELLLQHPYLLFLVLAVGFLVMDPFDLSPVGGIDFRPVKNDVAPYKQVLESWPRDNRSRLGEGNLEFVDEIFGPESLEFDIQGRGPYTGLADGRIVRWMGKDAGWETFALVTRNW